MRMRMSKLKYDRATDKAFAASYFYVLRLGSIESRNTSLNRYTTVVLGREPVQLAGAGGDVGALERPHGHARRAQHHQLKPLLVRAIHVLDTEL